jgi:hypothetical protein
MEAPSGLGCWTMKITSILGAAVAGVIVAAGVALAGNFSSNHNGDFFAPGTHQFYMWCAGAPDYMATQSGSSATDAQMRLYEKSKKEGKSTCWPVWQGRVAG